MIYDFSIFQIEGLTETNLMEKTFTGFIQHQEWILAV